MKKTAWIIIAIVVVVVGIGIYLSSKSPSQNQANENIQGSKSLIESYSHQTGSPSAKVTLVEFADYQCPFCGSAYQPVKDIVDKYSSNKDFNFVFRNFPLSQHADAQIAAEAAEAAGAQGKYFQMHDLLYQNQSEWSVSADPLSDFVKYAQQLALDTNAFKSSVQGSNFINQITQDEKDGEALDVQATPTFFLNGQKYEGLPSNLDSLVQAALNK
jgi:protein-disulfide isomerase